MTQTPKYLQYLDCADAGISFFIVVLKLWRLKTRFVFLSWSRWVEEAGLSSVVCTLRRLGLSVLQPVSSQACRLHTCGPHCSVVLALTPLTLYPSTTHLSSTPRRSSAPLPEHFPPSINFYFSVTFSTTVVPLYYLDCVELWNYYYCLYLLFYH